MGLSLELIDRVGYDGLEKVAGLCTQVATDRRFIAALLEMTPGLLDKVGIALLEKVAELCSQVAGYSSRTAVRLLGRSPELIDRVGYDVLEKVVGLCSQVAQEDSFVAARLLEMSPELIEKVSPDCLANLAELCCLVNRDDSFIAARVFDGSPELIARLHRYGDTELVTNVYGLCSQVARDYNWRTAVRLLGRGESSEYADFFEAITEGLELKSVRPVLLHYLNALLGYRIEIVEAQGAATTDGERIFLPGRVKEFEEEDRNFILYKVMATHEEAHLEYGSFDFELMRVQDVASKIKEKYRSGTIERGKS